MSIHTTNREASKDEMAREIDRCHAVIEKLEAQIAGAPAPPSGKLVEDMARAMTFEEASVLARKAIYDDGRGMIGVNRNYLQDRVARAILSVANKRTLSNLPGNGGQL